MQPSPQKVPEVKQMDMFEKMDIPYTPPPIVKKPSHTVESEEITNLNALHCASCGFMELRNNACLSHMGFVCNQCGTINFFDLVRYGIRGEIY